MKQSELDNHIARETRRNLNEGYYYALKEVLKSIETMQSENINDIEITHRLKSNITDMLIERKDVVKSVTLEG